MANGNLMQYIKSHPCCDRKALILQVAEAVEFLHVNAQLVHGDLKCENVLISDFGDALLADFGLSSFVDKSESLSTTMTAIRAMHTLQFAAPELLGILGDDAPPVSRKTTASDVYAFGMLVLEAISGQPPWGRKTNFAIITSVGARQHPPRPTYDGPHERPRISDIRRTLEATEPVPWRELPFHDCMTMAAYTPDGTAIIAISSMGTLMLFDIAAGHIRHLSYAAEDPNRTRPRRLAISPDGRHIACWVRETVMVLDAASGVPVMSLQHDGLVTCVAYSRDGTRIASGTDGGTIRLWDAATGSAVGRNLDVRTRTVSDVSFAPDGICLASASLDDGRIHLWDAIACVWMETIDLPELKHCIYSMEFSPDGRHIVAGYPYGMAIIRDVREEYTVLVFDTQPCSIFDVAFSPCGTYVASASEEGDIEIWHAQDGFRVGTALIASYDLESIAIVFSPDGKNIVSSAWDGKVRVWDVFD